MKTAHQIETYPKMEGKDTADKKEVSQPVLDILKETLEKFHSLDQEAEAAIYMKKDTITYKQKLAERAQLLIDLPNLLSGKLEGLEIEVKQRFIRDTESFAEAAKYALDSNSNFALEKLLTQRGDKVTDKNNLEVLIALIDDK